MAEFHTLILYAIGFFIGSLGLGVLLLWWRWRRRCAEPPAAARDANSSEEVGREPRARTKL